MCDSANEAGTATCSGCGFPAGATGGQIEHARGVGAGHSNSGVQPAPDFAANIQAALAPLPPHRKLLAVIGGALAFVGIVWFKVTFSWSGLAFSALATGAGVLLLALAYSGIVNQEEPRDAR